MSVEGAKEINANIEKALKIVSKSIADGLVEVGETGRGYAFTEAPRVTGRLANSMGYTIAGKVESMGPFEVGDSLKPSRDKDAVIIGTNVIYAPSVEYASKSRGYMQRAYSQLKPIAEKILGKHIKGGIK